MSDRILIAYATRYGSTEEVAKVVATSLNEYKLQTDLLTLQEVRTLVGYSSVVIGAPLYMFRWHKDALRFFSRHRKVLKEMSVAVFALGPTHIPHDENEWQDSRVQLDKALSKFNWFKPVSLEMFGGKYDPLKLRFPVKLLVGKEPASDIRDWKAIRSWADAIALKFKDGLS